MLRSRREKAFFTGLVAGILGLTLLGSAALVHGRALAGQLLLRWAWEKARVAGQPVEPWPDSDVRVHARLRVPRLGVERIVLDAATGQALAYAPGELRVGGSGSDVRFLAGHRDTHFAFLSELQPGDTLRLEDARGVERIYHVSQREVRHRDELSVELHPFTPLLYLVTCQPPDGDEIRSEERLVITARAPFRRQARAGSAHGD